MKIQRKELRLNEKEVQDLLKKFQKQYFIVIRLAWVVIGLSIANVCLLIALLGPK